MMESDPALIEVLALVGIIVTPKTKWHRFADHTQERAYYVGTVCWCKGFMQSLSMRPIEYNGRRLLVTQCPACRRTVHWCFWRMDGVWTGPEEIVLKDPSGPWPCVRASPLPSEGGTCQV
jgi:hypothetical protein